MRDCGTRCESSKGTREFKVSSPQPKCLTRPACRGVTLGIKIASAATILFRDALASLLSLL